MNIGPLAWSPDGTKLAFAAGPYQQTSLQVVTVADGSVIDLGGGTNPVWQPAGQ
jgi:hypothetical protein